MTALTILYAVLFYLSLAVFVSGTLYKLVQYTRTPAPLKIPLTPAPVTRTGVVIRLVRELLLFETLFKSSKWTWLFGWLFHWALLIVLLHHLRFFLPPVWPISLTYGVAGNAASWVMLFGLGGLLLRRIAVDRIRYISVPSDYLMLLLFLVLGITGVWMRTQGGAGTGATIAFVRGLFDFNWQALPDSPSVLIHLGLVILLLIIFPMSKLLHGPGILFSPTLNQVDDPREHRHVGIKNPGHAGKSRE